MLNLQREEEEGCKMAGNNPKEAVQGGPFHLYVCVCSQREYTNKSYFALFLPATLTLDFPKPSCRKKLEQLEFVFLSRSWRFRQSQLLGENRYGFVVGTVFLTLSKYFCFLSPASYSLFCYYNHPTCPKGTTCRHWFPSYESKTPQLPLPCPCSYLISNA